MIKKIIIIVLLLFSAAFPDTGNGAVNHDLQVLIVPESNFIEVTDSIRLNKELYQRQVKFLLHKHLKITGWSKNVIIKSTLEKPDPENFGINYNPSANDEEEIFKQYHLEFTSKHPGIFFIKYSGKINHPLKQVGDEYARGFSETLGIISPKGVYLAGSSFWIPWFNKELMTFRVSTRLPSGWSSISQGRELKSVNSGQGSVSVWDSPQPMDEIYLIAGKFKQYQVTEGDVRIIAYLQDSDPALARKYLQTTGQYLRLYRELIGDYPYSKFALIENFWETGYGMPSFTLLGPKVIRFPFILHSSYPHELLHNYWGNSVFVDYPTGNWCEGLTVYLADHLIKEQRGQGIEYRRTTLQGFTDYVNQENDFPLAQFRSRFDSASSAIGYGKSMMLFHMLRKRVGDKLFLKSLQDFYNNNKYKRASFSDIQKSFLKIAQFNQKEFFMQWLNRKGAPSIVLAEVDVKKNGPEYLLNFQLRQVQPGAPFTLDIPVQIFLMGKAGIVRKTVSMSGKIGDFQIKSTAKPVRIDIDPEFDVFRKLFDDEIPPSLSKAFGSQKVLLIVPQNDTLQLKEAYHRFANKWSKGKEDKFQVVFDDEITELPADRTVWIFGWNNKFKKEIHKPVARYKGLLTDTRFKINKQAINREDHSIIIAVKNFRNTDFATVFLSADNSSALPGLARKLPHYGKYSFLAFEGTEPTNVVKGQWTITSSPLIRILSPDQDWSDYKITSANPLGKLKSEFSQDALKAHIHYLSDKNFQGRGLGSKGIDIASEYIAEQFSSAGLKPGGDNDSYYQTFEISKQDGVKKAKNIIGFIPGSDNAVKGKPVVICAHYDHLSSKNGIIYPGADDNASGVAVMLELASYINKNFQPQRTVLFIAFSGEESGLAGSRFFLSNYTKYPVSDILAAVNLDTIGRLGNTNPMVIGAGSAREWRFIFMGIEYTTGIKTSLVKEDLDSSDQKSFIQKGIPGIQLFSGPNLDYHKPTDTSDKIDTKGMLKILTLAKEALVYLMERKESLQFTGKVGGTPKIKPSARKRKVSIGIMPDFSFAGDGVKVGLVIDKTPAQKAGLKKGDIITKLGKKRVNNLREYSELLKSFKPGESVELEIQRTDKVIKVKIHFK